MFDSPIFEMENDCRDWGKQEYQIWCHKNPKTFNIVPPYLSIFQVFGGRSTPSARPTSFRFRLDRPIARISSSFVLYRVSRSGSLILVKRSYSHKLRRKRWHLVVQNPIILLDSARSHTTAFVTDLLRHWQWEILEDPAYSPHMSRCYYDLFVKVKEPLRGTRYNTRDELIYVIRFSIWNVNKGGRADGVRRLPNIWRQVINMWRYINIILLWIKPCQKYRTVAVTFYPTLVLLSRVTRGN